MGDIAIYNLYQRLFFAGDYVKMYAKHLFLFFYVKTSDIISKSEMIRNLNAWLSKIKQGISVNDMIQEKTSVQSKKEVSYE